MFSLGGPELLVVAALGGSGCLALAFGLGMLAFALMRRTPPHQP